MTVFHAEQQVLIKKPQIPQTFTSHAEIKIQFELTAQKNLLSLSQDRKDNQKELTYTGYHRQTFFFPNYIFLISVTQEITVHPGKLPYLDFIQALNGVGSSTKE